MQVCSTGFNSARISGRVFDDMQRRVEGMKFFRCMFSVFFLLVVAGCSTLGVQTDYDPDASFSELKTYRWLPSPEGDPRVHNDIAEGRVVRNVDRVLGEKGYRVVTTDDADFLVGFQLALEGKLDVSNVDTYYGYHWGRPYAGGSPVHRDKIIREYDEGSLIIDIIDTEEEEIIWRGSAQADVTHTTGEENEKLVKEAVERMFRDFPDAR